MRLTFLAVPLVCALLAGPAFGQAWLAESAQTLPSSDTGWGDVALEAGGARLFIARRNDGLLVWDTKTREARTVADSKGVVAVVLAPESRRAYAATAEGALLAVDLGTLAVLSRTELGAGELGQLFYEAGQRRVHVLTGARAEKTGWISVDAATGQVVGRTEFNSKTMGAPSASADFVAEGAIFAPSRDRGLLQQVDPKDLSVQKTWRLGECQQPATTLWDGAARRVLIACRGDKPVFVALDPAAGIVATIPIGRGAEGMVFDAGRRLVAIANGTDGTLSVIRQDSPNEYSLVETTATRPGARVLAMDEATQRLFTVAATTTQPAGEGKVALHHPDSFTILTYRANRP